MTCRSNILTQLQPNSPNQVKLFSPGFLSSLAKFANVLIVAAFEMVWHEALADVLEKGKVTIADDGDSNDDDVHDADSNDDGVVGFVDDD